MILLLSQVMGECTTEIETTQRRVLCAHGMRIASRWRYRIPGIVFAILALHVAAACPAQAGFRVSPLKINLNQAADTGAITVLNQGVKPINLQMSAVEWTQDGEGKDVYTGTADLVFFPKLSILEPGGTQVVRVGIKAPAPAREKSYRLYVEQLPQSIHAEEPTISVMVKFGVAVYALPEAQKTGGELAEVGISGGVFRALVRNTGNVHFRIEKLLIRGDDRDGKEIFAKDLDGWYLLGGAVRRHEVSIPAEVCARLTKVHVSVKTDLMTFEGEATVEEGNCPR